MPGTFQRIINGPIGISLALTLGRIIPPSIGYPLADRIGGYLGSQRELGMVQVVRANHYVIHDGQVTSQQLDQAAIKTYRNGARCIYDLYHKLRNPEAIKRQVVINPEVLSIMDENQHDGKGRILVTVHTSNFELAFRAVTDQMANARVRTLTLAFPNPGHGYRWQNQLRQGSGVDVVPASTATIRTAARRLDEGGLILTGIDRPIPDLSQRSLFFGRPASLTSHHIMLALHSKIPVHVAAVMIDADGFYQVHSAAPVPMRAYTDRSVEIRRNTEAVLEVAADLIRCDPEQWLMYYPVWPEALDEMKQRGL